MLRAIFLDRDGVVIENRSDYVRKWSHVRFLPKVHDALSGFHRAGFKVIIVTNQSAVGRGLMTFDTAQAINDQLVKTIQAGGGWVDGVYMCTHTPLDHCTCRKPLPGLLLQAAQDLSLDLRASWMIGDAWSDLLAGQAAGVSDTIIVRTGRGSAQLLQTQPDHLKPFLISNDLFDAFQTIVQPQKNRS